MGNSNSICKFKFRESKHGKYSNSSFNISLKVCNRKKLVKTSNFKTHRNQFFFSLNRWLSTVARRMCNVFLHPDIIYKQTQLHQVSSDWYARSEVLPEKVLLKKKIDESIQKKKYFFCIEV